MFSMARTCEEFESRLNDGSWSETGGGGGMPSNEPVAQSVVRFAGLSAAALFSTVVMQRRVAHRMEAWDVDDGEMSPFPRGPIEPHPVSASDLWDASDTESVRQMPDSHCVDFAFGSDTGSVIAESVRSFSGKSTSSGIANTRLKLPLMKTIGTDPIKTEEKKEKKVEMIDRGCSPFPLECFDSDLDSEERFGLACDLWHLRPTQVPGGKEEMLQEQRLLVKSEQKKWLKQLETFRTDPWKRNPLQSNNKESAEDDVINGDSTWKLVKRYFFGPGVDASTQMSYQSHKAN